MQIISAGRNRVASRDESLQIACDTETQNEKGNTQRENVKCNKEEYCSLYLTVYL